MKRISILLVAILFTVVMAACQGNQAPPAQQTTPTPTAPPAVIGPPGENPVAIAQPVFEVPDDASPLPDGITPLEMYSLALQQLEAAMANADSFNLNLYTGFTMYIGDDFFGIESDIILLQAGQSETAADVKIDMIGSFMGERSAAIIYFRDGIVYIDGEYGQTQVATTLDNLFAETGISRDGFLPIGFDANDIVAHLGYETYEGGFELVFGLDPWTMDVALEQVFEKLEALNLSADIANVEPTNADLFVMLDENRNFTMFDLFVTFNIGIGGETAFVGLVMAVEYNQIGGVTIDFPDNLDTFSQL